MCGLGFDVFEGRLSRSPRVPRFETKDIIALSPISLTVAVIAVDVVVVGLSPQSARGRAREGACDGRTNGRTDGYYLIVPLLSRAATAARYTSQHLSSTLFFHRSPTSLISFFLSFFLSFFSLLSFPPSSHPVGRPACTQSNVLSLLVYFFSYSFSQFPSRRTSSI